MTASPEDVRNRLDFRIADADALDLSDDSFDTVLMGEIVEHSEDASPLLKEAARVLRPDGVLALTTPFGLSRHHDHHATFYVDSLVRLPAPHISIESLDIVDKYLRVRARPGAMAAPGPARARHAADDGALTLSTPTDRGRSLVITAQRV